MSYDKGKQLEAYFSSLLHKKYIPVLISPLVLRQLGAGQVDVAVFKPNELHLIEIKASGRVTFKQIERLGKSGTWLGHVLNCNCQLWLAKKLLPNGHTFTNLNL